MDDIEANDNPTLRITLMPKDTNYAGIIFGGVILSNIDLAGAMEARKVAKTMVVTVSMREVKFHSPVFVGDLVSFYAKPLKTGRTSITIHVDVIAERMSTEYNHRVRVTEAEIVYVSVDENRNPVPIRK